MFGCRAKRKWHLKINMSSSCTITENMHSVFFSTFSFSGTLVLTAIECELEQTRLKATHRRQWRWKMTNLLIPSLAWWCAECEVQDLQVWVFLQLSSCNHVNKAITGVSFHFKCCFVLLHVGLNFTLKLSTCHNQTLLIFLITIG